MTKYVTLFQRLHNVDLPGCDVYRTIYLPGGVQPVDLPANPESQRGEGPAVQAAAEGDQVGHNAHDSRHRLLHVQRPGSGHQRPGGKKLFLKQ